MSLAVHHLSGTGTPIFTVSPSRLLQPCSLVVHCIASRLLDMVSFSAAVNGSQQCTLINTTVTGFSWTLGEFFYCRASLLFFVVDYRVTISFHAILLPLYDSCVQLTSFYTCL